ncbi:MAG: branched-chain amino acid ABC transporter ATP-binding protein/permease [Dehalococcoidia bacterium]|nr:branched-chain amino acid ABC transporter ATP-binding protein/permease [Dehalococcoidia bacterium]
MDYFVHVANICLIWVMLGVSLNLLIGYSGLMSLGHAAFYGIGAYGSALMAVHLGANFFVGMLVGILAAAVIGILTAIPALRVKDEYLILLTLAVQMVVYGVIMANPTLTGGWSGISVPRADIFGLRLVGPTSYLPLILVFCGLCIALSWRVSHSPFGRVLKAMRDDEMAIRSLGKNLLYFKVMVFVLAGTVAAVAGSLFAHYMPRMQPTSFSVYESIAIAVIVVVGGRANIWGSVAAAFALTIIPEALTWLPGAGERLHAIRMVLYGAMLIVFIRFRPQGMISEYMKFRARAPTPVVLSPEGSEDILRGRPELHSQETQHNPGAVLEVEGLSKDFDGIRAVDNASFALPEGRVTALIGPNGAGKTTVFNLVTDFLKADGGRVSFRGRDITKSATHKITHLGVARSFQEVRVFPGMLVLDNVLVALPRQSGESLGPLFFRPWKVAKEEKENYRRAMAYLNFVGLAEKSQQMASDIAFAEQKLLALARLLATGADVLLLDEVVSGIDPASIDRQLGLLRRLAGWGKTICIIEHNLDVVRGVADTAHFMAEGRVIASGTPAELMADRKLAEMYFGT